MHLRDDTTGDEDELGHVRCLLGSKLAISKRFFRIICKIQVPRTLFDTMRGLCSSGYGDMMSVERRVDVRVKVVKSPEPCQLKYSNLLPRRGTLASTFESESGILNKSTSTSTPLLLQTPKQGPAPELNVIQVQGLELFSENERNRVEIRRTWLENDDDDDGKKARFECREVQHDDDQGYCDGKDVEVSIVYISTY